MRCVVNNMNIKRILICCLVFAILIGALPCFAANANQYPTVQFTPGGNKSVTIRINPGSGYTVSKKNIIIKADGAVVNADIRELSATVSFNDGNLHKINVTAMNSGGYKAVAGYTLNGNEYGNIFCDITSDDWARKYITYMNHYNIVKGTPAQGANYFYPRANITRGEFAVMVANMLRLDLNEFRTESLGTADEWLVPGWCINHAKALSEMGIMSGRLNNNVLVFEPGSHLTRAEAATVIAELLPDNVYTKEMTYKDAKLIPAWSYDSFKKLTSLGIIRGYSDGRLNPTGKLTRSEAIKLIYEVF